MARKQHGYGGHFAAWHDCLFRLHTSVNDRYRISTIGDYRPAHRAEGEGRLKLEPVTLGPDRLFETMVFVLKPDGDVESWSEGDSASYNTAAEAEAGHEAMVARYEAL